MDSEDCKKCENNTNYHICPFRSQIEDDDSKCNCCEEHTQTCEDAI